MWRPGYLTTEGAVLVAPPGPIEEEDTTAADWGTAMHEAKAGTDRAVDPWLSAVEPWRERLWPARLGVHEQLLAYNCRTSEVVVGPSNVSPEGAAAWKAQWGSDWVVGTCDWWAALPTGEGWISDLKTGWRQPEVVTPQTLFYAMCRAKVLRQDVCRVCIDWWPRGTAEPTRDGLWRQVTALVLDSFEDDLKRAHRLATGHDPAPRPGPWCQYCPSAGACDRAGG